MTGPGEEASKRLDVRGWLSSAALGASLREASDLLASRKRFGATLEEGSERVMDESFLHSER